MGYCQPLRQLLGKQLLSSAVYPPTSILSSRSSFLVEAVSLRRPLAHSILRPMPQAMSNMYVSCCSCRMLWFGVLLCCLSCHSINVAAKTLVSRARAVVSTVSIVVQILVTVLVVTWFYSNVDCPSVVGHSVLVMQGTAGKVNGISG